MAELTAEIVARFDQVQRELNKTNKEAAKLERELRRAESAAVGMDKSLDLLAQSADVAAGEMQQLNRSAGRSSSIFFQAGQAVSDFAVSGILGAANNIEFLAFQLGASGPLIAGITALSVAALVFRDDLEGAFSGFSDRVEQTKEDFDELLTIIGGDDRSLTLFEKRLPDALKAQQELVADLKTQLDETLTGSFAEKLFRPRLPTFLVPLTELEKSLADAEGVLEVFEKRLESLSDEQRALLAGQQNSAIRLQQTILQNQRDAIAELGLEKEIADVTDEKLAKALEENKLEELIVELKKSKAKLTKEEKTALDRVVETNQRLKEQLEALRDIESSRLGRIMDQNRELREQIKVVQRLNDERRRLGGTLSADVSAVSPAAQDRDAVTPLEDILSDISSRRRERQRNRLRARTLDPELIEEAAEAQDKQTEAIERTTRAAEELGSAIGDGLTGALSGFLQAVGSGEDPFTALRNQIGSFAVSLGETFIGFGLAGESLKSFLTNPATAIIAGSGLVVLGSALKRSAEEKANAFTSTGSASTAGQIPLADPRQGRDGRFRRDLSQFESGFQPISSLADFSIPEFTFRLHGEDFVAGTDRNVQRQQRTRGTSPVRASGARSTSR